MSAHSTKGTSEWIHCNECRSTTLHRVVEVMESAGRNDETGYSWSKQFETLQCGGCGEVVLRRKFWFSENDGVEVRYFPPAISRHPPTWRHKLPDGLRLLLEEIYKSLDSENVRLPLMGARTLLDMVILQKVGDVGTFKQKLQELEKRGFVSSRNREVLNAALDAGNAAAHRGFAATETELEGVMDIVENMLQTVYVFPKVARRLRRSTPRRRRRRKP